MKEPKVSVMFMSYNQGAYIKRAMDSVLNQTFSDFEIVLSDDCSKDKTKEILKQYKDNRISLHFFETNQGATINNLYIWKHCRGEYLALINSDDVWFPEHLQKSVNYLESHKECGVVFSWADLIDEDDNIIDPCCEVFKQPNRSQAEWVHYLFTKGNCLCHPSMVIRRTVYEEVGFYKLGFRQLPDYNMWTRMTTKYTLHILEEVLVHHRRCIRTGQNTSAPIVENSIRDVNESLYTLLHYFDDMPNELFCEAFKKEFRNMYAQSDAELLCEKFFLMYDEKYYMHPVAKVAAFLYLHNIYDAEEVWKILKEKYGFKLNDFHKLGTMFDLLNLKKTSTSSVILDKNDVKKKTLWKIIKINRGK